MTLHEKQRLRRIASLNAREYRRARRETALKIMRGADEKDLSQARWSLTLYARAVAEAIATLEDHADEEMNHG